MSFRRRRGGSQLRPVHSIKHVVDIQGGLILAVQQIETIAKAVDAPVVSNPEEVETGSRINALFLNVQVAASSTAALANLYFMIFKDQGGNISAGVIPNANAVGSSNMKTVVFHQEMIMTEKNTTAFPRTMFRGVLMIPRHMRRMGINDVIKIAFFAPGVNYDFCFQTIYKEFR